MAKDLSYDDLFEENLQLKKELGVFLEVTKVDRLRRYLGISPAEARILLCLYINNGPVSVDRLNRASAPGSDWVRYSNGAAVRVSRIKKRLGADCIKVSWGIGYVITDIGRALVKETLGNLL